MSGKTQMNTMMYIMVAMAWGLVILMVKVFWNLLSTMSLL